MLERDDDSKRSHHAQDSAAGTGASNPLKGAPAKTKHEAAQVGVILTATVARVWRVDRQGVPDIVKKRPLFSGDGAWPCSKSAP
jgi:hypothetical protein